MPAAVGATASLFVAVVIYVHISNRRHRAKLTPEQRAIEDMESANESSV